MKKNPLFRKRLSCSSFSLLFFLSTALAQPVLEIWQIQGSGVSSPYESERIRSNGNLVTAVDEDGFFMQTPAARSDERPATSDGIYVYLGQSSGPAVGDSVSVVGIIKEQFGLTEFSNVTLLLRLGTAAGLPAPVELDAAFPGTSPVSPAALEQVEGMRVRTAARVIAPNNRFGEFAVTANADRPFREPGIPFPGIPGLPVWDGNPEVFWVDPDGVGASDYQTAAPGDNLSATGVLSFSFGKYILLPESYQLDPLPFPLSPVREARRGEFTLASLNTFLLIREEDNYAVKVEKLARYILQSLRAPDIIALQEVGSSGALQDLRDKVRELDPEMDYQPFFGDSPDFIHLAYLIRPSVEILSVEALQKNERFSQGGLLHGRPPLLLRMRLGGEGPEIEVLNLHMRSLRDVEDPVEGPTVRQLRFEQSIAVARLVEERRDNNLFLLGDFNAYPFSDGYVDVVNQISGGPSLGALLPVNPIVAPPPLENLTTALSPADQRYSFIERGNAQLLDHCLAANLSGLRVEDLQFARGNTDAPFRLSEDSTTPLRSSDHDGFVVYLRDLSVASEAPIAKWQGIKIHPNPAQAGQPVQLEITVPGTVSVKLLSTNGKYLAEGVFNGEGSPPVPLPATLPAGYYFLQVQTEKGRATLPLIVQP